MRKLIYGFIILLALSSCNDFLDKTPDSRLEVDTPEKVAMLLVSAYPLNAPFALLEYMSDNYTDNGVNWNYYYDVQQEAYLYKDQSTITRDTPHDIWERCFKAIATANAALGASEELEKQGHDMSAHKAEARMCRAWSHFLLANTFCHAYNPQSSSTDLGLPYVEERISDVFAKRERGTVKELWDKMNDDIEAALPLIDDDLYEVSKNHFNRKAAYCFAAEFNLYYGNPDKAIQYANAVLGDNPASLMRDTKEIFNAGDDALVKMRVYNSRNAKCNLMFMSLISNWGRMHSGGSLTASRYGHNKTIASGATYLGGGPWSGKNGSIFRSTRLKLYTNYGPDQYCFYPKMIEHYESSTVTAYVTWMPFTTEKALLTRAEAYVLQGKYLEASEDLGLWYTSKHDDQTYVSPDEIVEYYKGLSFVENEEEIYTGATPGMTKFELNPRFDLDDDGMMEYMVLAVLHARRIELLFEGWRMIDLKRYGIEITHSVAREDGFVIAPWDERRAVQLPYLVIAAGMEPNPR